MRQFWTALSDRGKLLSLSLLILTGVALIAEGITALHLYAVARRVYAAEVAGLRVDLESARSDFMRAGWIATGTSAMIIIGAATLLWRVYNPFIRRLQFSEAKAHAACKELERKAADLERMNEELDHLTYIASHDLKEPLRGIGAYCEMLTEDYAERLGDDGARRLHTMAALCARLELLIECLMRYCRLGLQRPADRLVDLRTVVEECLDTLHPWVDRRGGAVRIVGPLPVVRGDATLLVEVFRNLVTNGLKFNDSAHPLVEIGPVADRPGAVFVRDNGIGVKPEHHAAVFEMFRRLHSSSRYEGTGAGLSFVKKIVEAHGGTVAIESNPGDGATFIVELPPAEATAGESAPVMAERDVVGVA